MSKITDIEFQGGSGFKHSFEVFTLGTETFPDVGGVYIFAKKTMLQNGKIKYRPLYIGQTMSFRRRLTTNHVKWPCAIKNDVDCVCVLVEENAFSRKAIESDLLSIYNTPCNRNGW